MCMIRYFKENDIKSGQGVSKMVRQEMGFNGPKLILPIEKSTVYV